MHRVAGGFIERAFHVRKCGYAILGSAVCLLQLQLKRPVEAPKVLFNEACSWRQAVSYLEAN